jgi:hypothetical protein
MPSPFAQVADNLEDLAAIFEPRQPSGGAISAGQARAVVKALKENAALARLGERQRQALYELLGRPVEEQGVTVILAPFATIDGGRAS